MRKFKPSHVHVIGNVIFLTSLGALFGYNIYFTYKIAVAKPILIVSITLGLSLACWYQERSKFKWLLSATGSLLTVWFYYVQSFPITL